MSELMGALHGIPAPEDRWDGSAAGSGVLEALVYRSNLLGADRALANQGGGNTSSKGTAVDHAGREQRVLWVKGSGTDLATITEAGFPALRLDEILPLRDRESMDDATMVEYLLRCGLVPNQPRPSIETLLHAFIPAAHVDHTHPDAIIALTSSPGGRRLAEETFGSEAVWLDYQRPGFDMSKRIAELLEANPSARAVLLEKHGLVTWGDTPEQSYRGTIEFVTRAVHALDGAADGRFGLGGRKFAELGEGEAETLLARALPALRGALLADADGVVLEVDRSPEAVAFASSVRAPEVSQIGAPCPDHLINTKHKPLVVPFDPETDDFGELAAAFRSGVDEYAGWYRGYYERNLDEETAQFPIDPAGPRVVLVPGVGIVTTGIDAAKARTARDLYHRAIAVAGRRGRGRRLPLPERGRGVRDRVLAARALQARAGAAAGRARRTRGRDHGRRKRDRTRDRACARRARRARRRRRPERRRRAGSRRRAGRRARPAAFDRRRHRRHRRSRREGDGAQDGARVRRPRHPRRLRRSRIERAGDGDEPHRLGAELRRARPRLLPRGAGGVPRPDRSGQRRLGRVRRLEERSRRRRERRRLLVREGGVAPSRTLPRRGGRPARDPRQHGQPRRGHPGLRHLVVRLEGRAGQHVRRWPRTTCRASTANAPSSAWTSIPRTSRKRSRSSPGRVPASQLEMSSTSTAASPPRIPGSAKEAHDPPGRQSLAYAKGTIHAQAQMGSRRRRRDPRCRRRSGGCAGRAEPLRRPARPSTTSRRTPSTRTR